jgi:uncharacterized protein YjbI with pentapeptide repeats
LTSPWLWLIVGLVIFLGWLTWETYQSGNLGFADKSYWAWMELLLVPAALGAAGIWFGRVQNQTELRIALERQRQTTLDQYFDNMTELILDRGLGSGATPEVIRLAKTRTLIAMRDLDAGRNGQVVQFLRESELLGPDPVVDLSHAELGGANLAGVLLTGAKLAGVNLRHANLENAILSGADLTKADLRGANMRGALLTGANLSGAILAHADLTKADLGGANLTDASLRSAKLSPSQLSRIGYAAKTEDSV